MENTDEYNSTSSRHEEYQYLDHIRLILKTGSKRMDRTKIGTLALFGLHSRYSLRNNTIPLLTTKKLFVKGVIEELLWFIRGSTNANELSEKGVKIWDNNSCRSFLDKYGFPEREEGDLGPVYGFQWRHYGAEYKDMNTDYTGQGIDQLKLVIQKIKYNLNGDKKQTNLMIAWNPNDIPKTPIPPCHCLAQFHVANGELSCFCFQRSGDMALGVPFNIASYSFLTHMLAHITGLKAGEFIYTIGECNVYLNHISGLEEQLKREPRKFPTLNIKNKRTEIEDFEVSDFEIIDYNPHPTIKMDMAV